MVKSDFFSLLESHHNRVLPWVAYRRPNQTSVKALLQHNDTLNYTSAFTESGFVFAPFDSKQGDAIIIPLSSSDSIIYDDNSSKSKNDTSKSSSEIQVFSTDVGRKEHIDLIVKAKDSITKGEIKKVVLSRKQKAAYNPNISPLKIFQKLLNEYPTAFVYCWYHPKVGLWLGATPETLMSINRGMIKTMSLAGTQKYLGTLDVAWGLKEQEEQQLVTDSIIKSLSPLTENLLIKPTHSYKAGNLLHLKTSIEGKIDLEKTSLLEIIEALHPTPAVCGLPKKEAKQFILKSENYKRTYYTGYLGELNIPVEKRRPSNSRNVENLAYRSVGKQSHLYVNLRCMEIVAQGAQLYVGGGITGASIPEAEWEETINKLQTMAKVL